MRCALRVRFHVRSPEFASSAVPPPKKRPRKEVRWDFRVPPKRYKLTRDHGPLSDPRWPGGRKGQKEAGEAGKKQRASERLLFFCCQG
jgi:hypothetical protein